MTNDRCINWPCAKDAGHEGPCGTSPDSRTSKELVARLRSVESRGERTIWTDAADEIERLLRERDALAAKVASYERADRDLNEALNVTRQMRLYVAWERRDDQNRTAAQ
jgi:hypothetical protein